MAVVPVLLKSIYNDVMKGKRERLNGLRVLTCGAAMFDPAVLQDLMDRSFERIRRAMEEERKQKKKCCSNEREFRKI